MQLHRRLKTYFHFFPIRLKLIIILTSLVLGVALALSLFVLQHEKRMLFNRLDEFCQFSVKTLSNTIGGDLLVKSDAQILEAVDRMQKSGIKGLIGIRVIDLNRLDLSRQGKIVVATNDPNYAPVDTAAWIHDEQLTEIMNLTHFQTKESPETYDYYYPIVIAQIQIGVVKFIFSKKVILKPIADAQYVFILVSAIIVLLSIIGIYFLSQKMVSQIQNLSFAVKQVAQGRLDILIPIKSSDEIGQLGRDFNNMVIGLREKFQMEKFVSKTTVRMIEKYGGTLELPQKSEKKEISVLFSDVRKFSLISEKHSPEEVVKLINIYLDLQAQIIEQNKGIVDKFVGDLIMGVFESDSHEKNALKAAVGIQKAICGLNRKRIEDNKVILEVGVGLNSGPAVLGRMGSQDRMDYSVVGSIVNVASYLCDRAKPRQILVTDNFIEKAQGIFIARSLDPIPSKGNNSKINVFEIDYECET
ncbi:HAMP domain-containing protein [candidate division KSB1 bacterium]|nr:HAMP domain-containing protein [candidate division KSB1 bacterium]